MNIPLSQVLNESNEFCRKVAGKEKYGDIEDNTE